MTIQLIKDFPLEKPYPNEHSCRFVDPKKFDDYTRVNCYQRSDGKCIDYIFGRLKTTKKWKVQAFRYSKNVWTESQAKKHCKDHEGILFEPAKNWDNIDTIDKEFLKKLKDTLDELNKM
jgi:hypothetical protein